MKHFGIALATAVVAITGLAGTQTNRVEIVAVKDNFGRSSMRHNNNGASPLLVVAYASNVRSLVGFDLAGVTNAIAAAEFRVCMQNPNPEPTTLVVAPMVHTTNNAVWAEGGGNLGVVGQNARVGEACFAWRAFPKFKWEDAAGRPLQNLMASGLWGKPLIRRSNLAWKPGEWIRVPVQDVQWLEDIRQSEQPVATFGLWGTAGDEIYKLHSSESSHPPKLILTLEEEK